MSAFLNAFGWFCLPLWGAAIQSKAAPTQRTRNKHLLANPSCCRFHHLPNFCLHTSALVISWHKTTWTKVEPPYTRPVSSLPTWAWPKQQTFKTEDLLEMTPFLYSLPKKQGSRNNWRSAGGPPSFWIVFFKSLTVISGPMGKQQRFRPARLQTDTLTWHVIRSNRKDKYVVMWYITWSTKIW